MDMNRPGITGIAVFIMLWCTFIIEVGCMFIGKNAPVLTNNQDGGYFVYGQEDLFRIRDNVTNWDSFIRTRLYTAREEEGENELVYV